MTELLEALLRVMIRGSAIGIILPAITNKGTVSNGALTCTTLMGSIKHSTP